MLRKIPNAGWLVLSIVLWTASIFYFRSHRIAVLPEQMVKIINADLANRDKELNNLLNDKSLVRRIFSDSLTSEEVTRLADKSFFLYAYDSDTLKYWNNNYVIAQNRDSLLVNLSLRKNLKGIFIRKYLRQTQLEGNKKLIVLFPLVISYPIENDYLHSHFAASENIPVKTKVSAIPTGAMGEYRIAMPGGEIAAYITINKDEIQKWTPDGWLIGMLIAAMLATISWLQRCIAWLLRNKAPFISTIVVTTIIVAARIVLFEWGVPFNLDTLTLFSPTLYASNRYLSSLGDLFISILAVLWLVTFIIRYTAYRTLFATVKNKIGRAVLAVFISVLLSAYMLFMIKIVRSLIQDSRISFDVTHFYSVTIYTGFGLLAIILIMIVSILVMFVANVQLNVLTGNKWIKHAAVVLGMLLVLWLFGHIADPFYLALTASVAIFSGLFDVPRLKMTYNIFAPQMIIWSMLLCAYATLLVHYYNENREKMMRMAFVDQRLSPHHDDQLELSFDKTARLIEKDRQLKNFFYKPGAMARRALNPHLDSLYLSSLGKYQTSVYLFDDENRPLFNKDTVSYELMMNEKTEAVITNSAYLFYRESILNRNYYISYLTVYNDTVNNVIGYVFITLDQKKAAETVYPELLQPSGAKNVPGDLDYSYAMYIGGKLITQTNDYQFPVRLKYDTLKEQAYVFDTRGEYSALYSKIADKRTAVVVHHHNELLEALTLFAYLFGIEVAVAIVILLFQLYKYIAKGGIINPWRLRLTIRQRVHAAILGIIIISFVVIGIVTVVFFRSEYTKSNDNKLQAAIQVAKQSVQEYLVKQAAFNTGKTFDSVTRSANFKSFVGAIATSQKIDINIFDERGALLTTSQEDIYDKGLISRRMKPDAYHQLNNEGVSLVVQKEKVASLSYTAAYEALRNENGVTLGYINIPFFTSEKDIDFQVSNIIVTLLSFYAILFLISSAVALTITGRITRSFEFIIKQFDKLNLERNERIEWKYDDEIGKLVKEYNKMVTKVEENAMQLAQSERETAWREMARQVAHEIKNPLTPMKLNIQYLQQAMRNNNPNIKQLTERVSASIIEQIDNLSYIASEFSNFAKMPEAKPEELDPALLMGKAAELYTKDQELDVTISLPAAPVTILCDHSQLLRVFTNLLENARQAIPDDRKGRIDIGVKQEGDDVIISVKDNGTGIDEEVSKRIFQPYFTTKNSGTGLGLAMTKKIIEFWQGQIWFDTREGEGTTFIIKLPLINKQ